MKRYQDASRPIEERVEDLLARMTRAEKIAQTHHHWAMGIEGSIDEAILRDYGTTGIGAIYVFWAEDRNRLQRHFVEQTRLGIPASFVTEALHGGAKGGTIFPMPLMMACSWDRDLLHRVYAHIAREARMSGANQTFSPNIDVHTDPRFGRVDEGFGECPYLTSEMGVTAVRALQGARNGIDQDHVAATAKHFAAYGAGECGQDGAPADISEPLLRDQYLAPFKAVVDAGVQAIMPAHHALNGIPCHADPWLLRTVLRDEWGFTGMVVSDAGDINGLSAHGVARDSVESAALGLRAGNDMELSPMAYQHLGQALDTGLVDEATLDDAVRHVLRLKFACGLFEHPYADPVDPAKLDSSEGRDLALQIAREGIVLLKNDGPLLPLDPTALTSLAVIGPNADSVKDQLGPYTNEGAHVVTPLAGLRARVPQLDIRYAHGCSAMDENDDGLEEAVALARACDAVVLVLGDAHESCRECYGHITGDRPSLELSGGQQRLSEAVLAANPRTVLVLIHGRPQSICWCQEHLPAILAAWRPGEEGGHAIADVLFGTVNPSGRLAMTFPRSAGHLPAYYNRRERIFGGRAYTFDTADPLYPFGFGLSYTESEYMDITASPAALDDAESIDVRVTVRNTGERCGADVVQLYLRDPIASVVRPVRQLVGFARVELAPGEEQRVTISVPRARFGFHDRSGAFIIEPGTFELIAARHAADSGLRTTVHLEKADEVTRSVEAGSMFIPEEVKP